MTLSKEDAERLVAGSTPVGVVADLGPGDLCKSAEARKAREAARRRESRDVKSSSPASAVWALRRGWR